MNRRARSTPVASLSIVLPAYNEEANIERSVEQCVAVASRLAKQYEVIVVDDGSSDGTRGVVEGLVRHSQNKVRLLSHHTNRGYGAALRTGVTSARYDFVFFTDSDNQFDVSELEYFLPLMDEYEMVTGFRVYRYDTVLRCMLSWIYNRLVGVLRQHRAAREGAQVELPHRREGRAPLSANGRRDDGPAVGHPAHAGDRLQHVAADLFPKPEGVRPTPCHRSLAQRGDRIQAGTRLT